MSLQGHHVPTNTSLQWDIPLLQSCYLMSTPTPKMEYSPIGHVSLPPANAVWANWECFCMCYGTSPLLVTHGALMDPHHGVQPFRSQHEHCSPIRSTFLPASGAWGHLLHQWAQHRAQPAVRVLQRTVLILESPSLSAVIIHGLSG